MKKLEPKHLCGYLPYGLKGIEYIGAKEYVLERISANNECLWAPNYDAHERLKYSLPKRIDCIPLLLHLSALTEPLEDCSVPIVELAKIAFGQIDVLGITQKDGLYAVKFTDEEDDTTVFSYNTNVCSFQADYMNMEELERRITIVPRQLHLFEYLYSKHFDIHNRIPAGLAIDKRTVK